MIWGNPEPVDARKIMFVEYRISNKESRIIVLRINF